MSALINRNLKEHRGSPRIYLDNLLMNEFAEPLEGSEIRYDRIIRKDSILCKVNPHGEFTLSRKTKNGKLVSVLDINNKELADLWDIDDKLNIAVKRGSLIIKSHALKCAIKKREANFARKILAGEAFKVGSLYHGGGVLDRANHSGLSRAGLKSVTSFAVEIEEKYLTSSMQRNKCLFDKNTQFINSDISDINFGIIGQQDIIIAGIPCTGASIAGRSKNKLEFAESHDTAGALFFDTLTAIKSANASIVIIENVKQYLNTASFVVIQSVLKSLGYELFVDVLSGDEFGGSERRERMACVAVSKGLAKAFNFGEKYNDLLESQKKPARPLADCIIPLAANDSAWKEVTYLKKKQESDLAKGKGFKMQILTTADKTCGTIGKSYQKARTTEPRLAHPTNPALSRLFKAKEHASIKGGPYELIDGLSETVAHEILGNGVMFDVFEAVGFAIGSVFNDTELLNDELEYLLAA